MHHDYYLKFADAAEANAVLFDQQTIVDGGTVETVPVPRYAAVDVLGVIYAPTGKLLMVDDEEVPEMAPLPGWHVNVRHTAEAPELAPYVVTVRNPKRMWA